MRDTTDFQIGASVFSSGFTAMILYYPMPLIMIFMIIAGMIGYIKPADHRFDEAIFNGLRIGIVSTLSITITCVAIVAVCF